jgi:hypothetical protein
MMSVCVCVCARARVRACGIQAFIELGVIRYYFYSIYTYVVFTTSALTWLTSFNGESWVHGKYKQDGQFMCNMMMCVRIPIVAMVTQ